eukprot:scaffold98026_cov21-Phaeocystis_antarctica.AAC.1
MALHLALHLTLGGGRGRRRQAAPIELVLDGRVGARHVLVDDDAMRRASRRLEHRRERQSHRPDTGANFGRAAGRARRLRAQGEARGQGDDAWRMGL